MDPGWIALIIFGGVPTGAIAGYGTWRGAGSLRATLARRRYARLESDTLWSPFKDMNAAGKIVIGVHRAAKGHTFDRHELFTLAGDADALSVALQYFEANRRATLFNDRWGRKK